MRRAIALLWIAGGACGGPAGRRTAPEDQRIDPAPPQAILATPWAAAAPATDGTAPWTGDVVDGDGTAAADSTSLAVARTFAFTSRSAAVLPGDSRELHAEGGCDGLLADADRLDRVAVRSTFYQNGCYTDGSYNARDFPIETGVVTASDGGSYQAFRVSPATSPATQFLASRHFIYYQFDVAEDHTLYTLEAGAPVVQARLAANQLVAGDHARLPIDASVVASSAVYFLAPSSEPVSALSPLGPRVSAALLARTPLGEVALYQHAVDGVPFDTRTGFAEGPSSWANTYSNPRHFFPVELVDKTLGVVWQDTASLQVRVTTTDRTLTQQRSTTIDHPGSDLLVAAASDGVSNLYLFFVQDGDGAGDDLARTAHLMRVDLTTGAIAQEAVDTSRDGLDMTAFGTSNVASLAYTDGRLGLVLGRTMHRSPDGLNHQGAIAVVFDAATLRVIINHGQTSGHSFENVVLADGAEFAAIDLGDNYPRGVHLHRFTASTRDSAIVYTFKTAHGQSATSPAGVSYPVYDDLSGEQTYYQWSNDNSTYTELGGLVADADGYTVVFTSEAAGGRALDNRRTGAPLNDPRDVGLVRVRRDFEKHSTSGNMVSDELVLSSGAVETGGFYSFGGTWTEQRNAGVVWLTDHDDLAKGNASRVRAVGLADGNLVVLWEQWTASSYVTTYGMKVDRLGKMLTAAVELGAAVRLGRRDDVIVRGNDVLMISGRAAERALDIVVLRGG